MMKRLPLHPLSMPYSQTLQGGEGVHHIQWCLIASPLSPPAIPLHHAMP